MLNLLSQIDRPPGFKVQPLLRTSVESVGLAFQKLEINYNEYLLRRNKFIIIKSTQGVPKNRTTQLMSIDPGRWIHMIRRITKLVLLDTESLQCYDLTRRYWHCHRLLQRTLPKRVNIHKAIKTHLTIFIFVILKHQSYSLFTGCLTAAVNYYRGLQRYQRVPYPHGNKIKVGYICVFCVSQKENSNQQNRYRTKYKSK